MKERPIIFSTLMVPSLLAHRKTMTRRIVKPLPDKDVTESFLGEDGIWRFSKPTARHPVSNSGDDRRCPYGKVGDILWVRESFAYTQFIFDKSLIVGKGEVGVPDSIIYKADDPEHEWDGSYKSPIYIPKESARIWLRVEAVKVERLQDISPTDALNEGVESWNEDYASEPGAVHADYKNYLWVDDASHPSYHFPSFSNPVDSFESLWKSINGVKGWEANPWLWAITFKVLSTNGRPNDL